MAAVLPTRRIEALVFDAMYTVIEPKGCSRPRMNARVFSEELKIAVNPRKLERVTRRVRENTGATAEFHRNWSEWNTKIVAELTGKPVEKVSREKAEAIHSRILSDVSLYEVREDMRELLRFAKQHFRLAIGSNQSAEYLLPMVEAFGLREFFEERIFTSDELGVNKPNPDFFVRICQELQLAPDRTCYIGNSVRNDISAAWLNIPVVLFDRDGKIQIGETGGGLTLVTIMHSIRRFRSWLRKRAEVVEERNGNGATA